MLENLPSTVLPQLLRRCALTSLLVGAGAFLVAVFLTPPLGALGVLIGVGLALLNLRILARQSLFTDVSPDAPPKSVRRQLRSKTFVRLLGLTFVAGLALWISFPLGMGIVAGLALYQIVFVANVFRAVVAQGGVQ